jgi:hypothetical protein
MQSSAARRGKDRRTREESGELRIESPLVAALCSVWVAFKLENTAGGINHIVKFAKLNSPGVDRSRMSPSTSFALSARSV